MDRAPLSGDLFVFVNRRKDRIKILYWGQSGFCIWYQQLQRGTYQLPSHESQDVLEVTRSQLSLILDGIDLGSVQQRPRYQREGQEVLRACGKTVCSFDAVWEFSEVAFFRSFFLKRGSGDWRKGLLLA